MKVNVYLQKGKVIKLCECGHPVPGTTVNNFGYKCLNCDGWMPYRSAFIWRFPTEGVRKVRK